MDQNFAVYSFADTKVIFNHPDVGQKVLSDGGTGKITVDRAGDMSSHTQTANGYTISNRLKNDSGTITIEVAQNSSADAYLKKYVKYVGSSACSTDRFAMGSITINDTAVKEVVQAEGVTPQKKPTRVWDTAAGMVAYAFLAADIQDK